MNVIVVARDLWPMTQECLSTMIFTADMPWNLIFVNNGSEPEVHREFNKVAPSWSWTHFDGYQYVQRKSHVSLAAAWNAGWKVADRSQEFTMFANNDIKFYKHGWMSQMVASLTAGFNLVGIQEMTWYRFRFVQGSLMVARTSDLEVVEERSGLFDYRRFPLSCEDVDLSHRFLARGLKIGQVVGLQPDYLLHIGSQTIQHVGHSTDEDLTALMHKSRRALCEKWGFEPQVED